MWRLIEWFLLRFATRISRSTTGWKQMIYNPHLSCWPVCQSEASSEIEHNISTLWMIASCNYWTPHSIILKSLNHVILPRTCVFIYLCTYSLGVLPFNLTKYYKIIHCSHSYEWTTSFTPTFWGVWTPQQRLQIIPRYIIGTSRWYQDGWFVYRYIPCIPDASEFPRDSWRSLEPMKTMMTGHTELRHQFCCGGEVDFCSERFDSWQAGGVA